MNQETKTNKTGFTTKSITMMALFAAILCISAYISIPLPIPGSPHITLLNFVIIVIALLFPLSQSFITILVIDIIGMLFWKVNAGLSWKVAFLSGFVAFIPLDLVKAVIAAQIIPAFRKVMQSAE